MPGSFTRLIVSSANESGSYVYAAQSLGNFGLSYAVALPRGPACASNTVVLAADVNGDSRPELLAISPGNGSVGLAVHVVALTTDEKVFGRTFSRQYPAIVSPPSSDIKLSDSIITADFTGDGRVDIALFRIPYYTNGKHSYCTVYDSVWHPVIYALPSVRIPLSPFDRLTRLVDGNGLTTRINYALMTNAAVYKSLVIPSMLIVRRGQINASAIASLIPNVIYTPSARFLVQGIDKDNALGDGNFSSTRSRFCETRAATDRSAFSMSSLSQRDVVVAAHVSQSQFSRAHARSSRADRNVSMLRFDETSDFDILANERMIVRSEASDEHYRAHEQGQECIQVRIVYDCVVKAGAVDIHKRRGVSHIGKVSSKETDAIGLFWPVPFR